MTIYKRKRKTKKEPISSLPFLRFCLDKKKERCQFRTSFTIPHLQTFINIIIFFLSERCFGLAFHNGGRSSLAGGSDAGTGQSSTCHCGHSYHRQHIVHHHHHGEEGGEKSCSTGTSSCVDLPCTVNGASMLPPLTSSCNSGITTHQHCHGSCHRASVPIQNSNGVNGGSSSCTGSVVGSSAASVGFSDSSESEDLELCASPRMQRKRYRNRQRERERLLEREREREWERTRSSVHLMPEPTHPHQLVYNDILPEAVRLVEVSSNIWGTKFKIHGVSPSVPESLGQVTYKTSLLHLQPRQMTLLITELRDDIFFSPDSLFVHGAYVDEDEEDLSIIVGGPGPSSSGAYQNQQQYGMQHGAVIMQNGGGVRGDVYTGANVIYHPQGVPRGEDSPPIISTSRCYLQSSSVAGATPQQQTSSTTTLASSLGTSVGGSPFRNPGPSSSSGASTSSCCSSSALHYASSSTSTTTRSDSALPFDIDDQDEFPYVDLTANSEIIQFRETLRNSLNYESAAAALIAGGGGPPRDSLHSTLISSNCRNNLCQVCETSSPQTPVKVATAVGGGGCAAEASIDLSDKAMQRVKYGMTRAQIERVVDGEGMSPGCSMVGGVATSTPSLPRTSSRSLRSPKKVSGFGSTSAGPRLSTPSHSHQVSSVDMNPVPAPSSSSSNHHLHHQNLYYQQQQQMQPVPVTAPMFVRRSMSASYLDSVDRNVVISLDVVGNEQIHNSPPKRLILVKKRRQEEEGGVGDASSTSTSSGGKPRLKDWGKSKSWDSCDLRGWKRGSGGVTASSTTSPYCREVLTSACPKCRFPSTEPVRTCVTMAEPLLLHCRSKVPMTPARRNVMTNCSTSRIPLLAQHSRAPSGSGGGNGEQHPQQSPSEDVIEIASDPSPPNSSTPTHTSHPPLSTPPPPPSSVHRRSLSLLTPLLRRREMFNAARQQQSADGATTSSKLRSNGGSGSNNAPHSSSFIPPGSPQHQPRSSPSTPATQRRSKQSYLSSASSPFRQLFINSPLLTRRKNKNNGGTTSGMSNGTSRSQRRRSIIDSSDEEGMMEEGNVSTGAHHHHNPSGSSGYSTMHTSSDGTSSSCARHGTSSSSSSMLPCVNGTPLRDCEILTRSQIHQKVRFVSQFHILTKCISVFT